MNEPTLSDAEKTTAAVSDKAAGACAVSDSSAEVAVSDTPQGRITVWDDLQ